jgi:hypothetical protein
MEGRQMNSDVFMLPQPPRWNDPLPYSVRRFSHATDDASEPKLSPREKYKRKLARAWMNSAAPRYWDEPPIDPVTAVVVPAAINPRKGSGPVTAEEIERHRAAEQATFVERLQRRWISNLSHL